MAHDSQQGRDIITVDGLAASGKSALAKGLALKLGYGHLNSGLLYRAVALLAKRRGADLTDSDAVVRAFSKHTMSIAKDSAGSSVVLVDGVALGDELLSADISQGASMVARHQPLRDLLISTQREAFLPDGIVAEGRDMGTAIFPQAGVKFFVVARADVRAERRFKQLRGTPQERLLGEIKQELEERDQRDATSSVGTMKQAQGAVLIDNSDQPLEEVIDHMLLIARGNPTGR